MPFNALSTIWKEEYKKYTNSLHLMYTQILPKYCVCYFAKAQSDLKKISRESS